MTVLPREFYKRKTITVAKDLLGKVLVRKWQGKFLSGKIVETEAYLKDDPACHASRGITTRTAPMFEAGGISYVYLIYGMYSCFNVVSGNEGEGEAVLIRALEPLEGIEEMQNLRKTTMLQNLCSGPGKLCQALNLDRSLNNSNLTKEPIYILDAPVEKKIYETTRIGISKGAELKLRYYIEGSPFISRP